MSCTMQRKCACEEFIEALASVLPPVAPCALLAVLLALLSSSNFWWSDSRVLRRLQQEEPSVVRIVSVERHLWSPPVFMVESESGAREAYLLETDVMQRSYFFRR